MIEGVLRVAGTGMRSDPGAKGLPWHVQFSFRPPEFMVVAFVCMHGGSEWYEFSAATPELIAELLEAERENAENHPRLSRISVWGPGYTREFRKYPTTEEVATLSSPHTTVAVVQGVVAP